MEAVELYRRYRPTLFKQVVGQDAAVSMIKRLLDDNRFPHATLFTGPSGVGKTTLARIIKTKLECGDGDFQEINGASFRGIDMVRDIQTRMHLRPAFGKCRIWLIDEAQKLSSDAQNAFLKSLEDTPKHVYFILATTDPNKLIKTIITRCTEVKLKELSPQAQTTLINSVCEQDKIKITDDVRDKVIECALGSGRLALVLLSQIKGVEDEEEQLACIERNLPNKEAILIARALLDTRTRWFDMAKILKGCEEDPESIRWLVLSYMTNVMLSGGKMSGRAFLVIDAMDRNFFDTRKAGLVHACYGVVHAR